MLNWWLFLAVEQARTFARWKPAIAIGLKRKCGPARASRGHDGFLHLALSPAGASGRTPGCIQGGGNDSVEVA